jgi:predicted flavoprotein YhiN
VVLAQILPRRLAGIAIEISRIPADRKAAELSKVERARIVQTFKWLPVPLTGTLGV